MYYCKSRIQVLVFDDSIQWTWKSLCLIAVNMSKWASSNQVAYWPWSKATLEVVLF